MDILSKVKNEIMLLNGKYMTEAEDNYDYWMEHVRYVVKHALDLARKYDADTEIVELAAMLHDIALMAKAGARDEHHIIGADIADTILSKYKYPQERIKKVKTCVYNHRSSVNATSVEDTCVADADILSHFDNIPMLFNSVLNNIWGEKNTSSLTLPELRDTMKKSFEYDFNCLSEMTKQSFCERYKEICQIVLGM